MGMRWPRRPLIEEVAYEWDAGKGVPVGLY
jgi:hypothetical protein